MGRLFDRLSSIRQSREGLPAFGTDDEEHRNTPKENRPRLDNLIRVAPRCAETLINNDVVPRTLVEPGNGKLEPILGLKVPLSWDTLSGWKLVERHYYGYLISTYSAVGGGTLPEPRPSKGVSLYTILTTEGQIATFCRRPAAGTDSGIYLLDYNYFEEAALSTRTLQEAFLEEIEDNLKELIRVCPEVDPDIFKL